MRKSTVGTLEQQGGEGGGGGTAGLDKRPGSYGTAGLDRGLGPYGTAVGLIEDWGPMVQQWA